MKIRRTGYFEKWFSKLKDKRTKNIILERIYRIQKTDNLGDYKSVGDEVFELRIAFNGTRIYFSFGAHNEIIILLIGGNKSSQSRDIEKAKKIKRGL